MLYENPVGTRPTVADSATIHTSAKIIGNVYIGDNVYIGPNAVIRADEPCLEGNFEGVIVEPGVNIQDSVIIHALNGTLIRIGKGATLAHEAVIIGPCDVGENCFIGFKSLVFKANLGKGVVVQHQALVEWVSIKAGREVPAMATILTHKDASKLKPVSGDSTTFAARVRCVNSICDGASKEQGSTIKTHCAHHHGQRVRSRGKERCCYNLDRI